MLRASEVCEKAGYPTSSLVCEGFLTQAAATSVGLGYPNMPVATIIGHPGAQSVAEIRRNAIEVTAAEVIANLTVQPDTVILPDEPGSRDIVFTSSFEAVNDFFYDREWSDGLPIVPPTMEKIAEFLSFTDRKPDETLGIVLPESRAVTVWSIAVNGVMAGCRPEYMPILVALGEAMADPDYGVEHSGNTPGSETLIVLNGPIIKDLKFNYEQGVLRDGFKPNTSVGRFWRLALRNIAGFRLHKTDKGTFGNTFRVVLTENEDALARIGWPSNAEDMGFKTGDNTVTITRMTGGDVMPSVTGATPEAMLPYLADGVAKEVGWEIAFTVGGLTFGTLRPALVLSPILAETIAKAGWSKDKVKQYLFDHARMSAGRIETMMNFWTEFKIGSLKHQVMLGRLPRVFAESDDPERLVPIVTGPDEFMVLVSGDPLRTNAYAFAHNGYLGFPVAKKIVLPKDWTERLGES
ncbi:MAG: UGSC family (seleno)protein [Novosphingobium sp.]